MDDPGRQDDEKPAHDIHLTPAARAIIEALPRREKVDLVFRTAGKTPISGYCRGKALLDAAIAKARTKAAMQVGREAEPLAPWRLHDMRRTGMSKLAALGFRSIVADKLLAHKPTTLKGVASVYQRHGFAPERARALQVWADHVTGVQPGGTVVSLRRYWRPETI